MIEYNFNIRKNDRWYKILYEKEDSYNSPVHYDSFDDVYTDFYKSLNSFEYSEAIGLWNDSQIKRLYRKVYENAKIVFNQIYKGSYVCETGEYGVSTVDLFWFLWVRDYKDNEDWCSLASSAVSRILDESMQRFIDIGKWHVGLRREDGHVSENIAKWPNPKILKNKIIWEGRIHTYQPIMWFGCYKHNAVFDDYWSLCRDLYSLKAFKKEYIPAINFDVYGYQGEYMDTRVAECNADYVGLDDAMNSCPLREISKDLGNENDPYILLDHLCLKLWRDNNKTMSL